jgi:hypothetical protein
LKPAGTRKDALIKALLRRRRGQQYLRDESDWTPDRSLARSFETGAQAIQFATQKGLNDVDLVLAFDDPQYDITLRMSRED